MGCCKCEKFKWPDPQPVIWRDEKGDGKDYCVFHAPVECKGIKKEIFNELVWKRIDDFKSIEHLDTKCILDGALFPDEISFTKYNKDHPLPAVSFRRVTFGERADFGNTTLSDGVDFSKAAFAQEANFFTATLGDGVNFLKTTFADDAIFTKTNFGEGANFKSAKFGEAAGFQAAAFGDHANFNNATFGTNAFFAGATFGDGANFEGAKFGVMCFFGRATFGNGANFAKSTFGARAHFGMTTLGERAYFTWATFGERAGFDEATFGSRLSFAGATIGPRSSFNSTRLTGSATFNLAMIQEGVTFSNVTFQGKTYFYRASFGDNVRFSEVTFDNRSSFSEDEFGKQVIFSKCDFKQPALFRNPLSITDLRFQDMTAEQFKNADFIHCPLKDVTFTNIEWPRHDKEDRYHLPIEDNENIDKTAVAGFYRQMKKRSIDEQNQAEASFWHFAEKEAFRKHLKASKDKLLLRFYTGTYRLISHYGESPTRALVVLAGLLALLAVVVALGGFAIHGIKPPAFYSERLGKFFLTFGQYALLTTPTYTLPPGYAAIALVISRLFIPIQAAIFGFALRNKLRR